MTITNIARFVMKVHKNVRIMSCISFLPTPFNLTWRHSLKCIHNFQNILNAEFLENACHFPSISSSILSMKYMENKVNNSITWFFLKIVCLFFCEWETRKGKGTFYLLLYKIFLFFKQWTKNEGIKYRKNELLPD